MKLPSTRSEAKKLGSKLYFTGKPCKHGHTAPREVKGTCTECRKAEWAAANDRRKALPKSEASKAAGRRYYEKNKEHFSYEVYCNSVYWRAEPMNLKE